MRFNIEVREMANLLFALCQVANGNGETMTRETEDERNGGNIDTSQRVLTFSVHQLFFPQSLIERKFNQIIERQNALDLWMTFLCW